MITSTEKIGVLKSNNLNYPNREINIRSRPLITASIRLTQPPGTRVIILDKTQPSGDIYAWYCIRYGDDTNDIGWVREDVINILPSTNPPDADTRIFFETQSRQVRVYGSQQPYMNVYLKKTNTTELLRANAVRVPKVSDYERWISYITIKDNTVYQVRFIPLTQNQSGQAELIIGNSNNGRISLQEKGFAIEGYEYNQL